MYLQLRDCRGAVVAFVVSVVFSWGMKGVCRCRRMLSKEQMEVRVGEESLRYTCLRCHFILQTRCLHVGHQMFDKSFIIKNRRAHKDRGLQGLLARTQQRKSVPRAQTGQLERCISGK